MQVMQVIKVIIEEITKQLLSILTKHQLLKNNN